jgi:hypothetical protein
MGVGNDAATVNIPSLVLPTTVIIVLNWKLQAARLGRLWNSVPYRQAGVWSARIARLVTTTLEDTRVKHALISFVVCSSAVESSS